MTKAAPNVWDLTNDEIKALEVGSEVTDHTGRKGIYCGTRVSGYVVVAWKLDEDSEDQWKQYSQTLIRMTEGN